MGGDLSSIALPSGCSTLIWVKWPFRPRWGGFIPHWCSLFVHDEGGFIPHHPSLFICDRGIYPISLIPNLPPPFFPDDLHTTGTSGLSQPSLWHWLMRKWRVEGQWWWVWWWSRSKTHHVMVWWRVVSWTSWTTRYCLTWHDIMLNRWKPSLSTQILSLPGPIAYDTWPSKSSRSFLMVVRHRWLWSRPMVPVTYRPLLWDSGCAVAKLAAKFSKVNLTKKCLTAATLDAQNSHKYV